MDVEYLYLDIRQGKNYISITYLLVRSFTPLEGREWGKGDGRGESDCGVRSK